MSENVSRRQFLKLGGGVVAGAGIAAAGAVAASPAIGAPALAEEVATVSPRSPDVMEALQARQANVASYLVKVSEEA